jgi:hypothetical protein
MAIPNYYYPYQPAQFNPYPAQANVEQPQMRVVNQQQDNSIKWVQGEAGAKAYPVAPNTSVLLMDSENSVMYIKTADNSGMPLPLRIFDYTERKAQSDDVKPINPPIQTDKFICREEFDELKEEVKKLSKGNVRKPNVKED